MKLMNDILLRQVLFNIQILYRNRLSILIYIGMSKKQKKETRSHSEIKEEADMPSLLVNSCRLHANGL